MLRNLYFLVDAQILTVKAIYVSHTNQKEDFELSVCSSN